VRLGAPRPRSIGGRQIGQIFPQTMNGLELQLLESTYAVSRLAAGAELPGWARGELVSLTRTSSELSLVSEAASVPAAVRSERGWRALRVAGTLDLSLIGILAELSGVLARARVAIFVVSTFDTDCLLVREHDLARAVQALEAAGHRVSGQ
jgi:hypothetical protein